jgi:hypothetical protein
MPIIPTLMEEKTQFQKKTHGDGFWRFTALLAIIIRYEPSVTIIKY